MIGWTAVIWSQSLQARALDARQRPNSYTPRKPRSGRTFRSRWQAFCRPDIDGTEIVIESTANGYNEFHSLWRKAEAGESEFLPIFLPWSLDPGYRRRVEPDFVMDSEEKKLAELHGLDIEQIAWRRAKISQLGSADYFAQEYPLHSGEAFISSTFDSFIPANLVIAARKEEVEPYGPTIIGVDPAGMGADRTSIAWRKGRCITKIESRRGLDTMEIVVGFRRSSARTSPTRSTSTLPAWESVSMTD